MSQSAFVAQTLPWVLQVLVHFILRTTQRERYFYNLCSTDAETLGLAELIILPKVKAAREREADFNPAASVLSQPSTLLRPFLALRCSDLYQSLLRAT